MKQISDTTLFKCSEMFVVASAHPQSIPGTLAYCFPSGCLHYTLISHHLYCRLIYIKLHHIAIIAVAVQTEDTDCKSTDREVYTICHVNDTHKFRACGFVFGLGKFARDAVTWAGLCLSDLYFVTRLFRTNAYCTCTV